MTVKAICRSLYHHRAGIRDKYVKRALKEKKDLEISYNGETMLIPYQEIGKKIVGKSKQPFPDKFSDEKHFLLYFHWQPLNQQKSLFNVRG